MKNKTRNASQSLGSKTNRTDLNSSIPKRRYVHYAIFAGLFLSVFVNLQALWGLFFIGLTIPAYRNRAVFFLDMVERDKEPKFYWLVFITWITFGVMMVLQDWATFGQFIPWITEGS